MLSKMILGVSILAGVLAFGTLTPKASAQIYGGYYGRSVYDYVPHWHWYDTPYGPRAWYGVSPGDYRPKMHYYYVGPDGSYMYSPYRPSPRRYYNSLYPNPYWGF